MIDVQQISKYYRLNSDFNDVFIKKFFDWRRDRNEKVYKEVLKNINFSVKEGEVVGIIGKNGAGKSTLLKILSGITKQSSGVFNVNGRVASLLEVGTGFHPELTGRENIFLNSAILGMTGREVRKKFDEIVDFSGVEEYLDTPVKRYSSGMYVRLAFSVAAHLEQEVLIVDEVLAVGDHQFQKKCLDKMSGVASSGRTVLFVSHNFEAVRNLCNRGIVLKNGSISYDGNVSNAISDYIGDQGVCYDKEFQSSDRSKAIKRISLHWDKTRLPNTNGALAILIYLDAIGLNAFRRINPQVCIAIRDKFGGLITTFISDYQGLEIIKLDDKVHKIRLNIPRLPLVPGSYTLDVKYWVPGELVDEELSALTFEVEWEDRQGGLAKWDSSFGNTFFGGQWEDLND